MKAWVVRAGRGGARAHVALEEGLVIAGWQELGDLSAVSSREDLRALIAGEYADSSPQVIANWTGQLWRFLKEMVEGDVIVTPLPDRRIAVGYLNGPYQYREEVEPELRHVRSVKWKFTDLDRHVVQPDLRDSLGSLLTVFELRRHEAARRMQHLADTGTDPGSSPSHASPALASLGSSPERLQEYVRNATADDETVNMTIREFIGIWGRVHRWPSVVEEIEADLEAFGLTTQPPFADYALNLNSRVTVIPVGAEPEPGTHVPTAAELPVAAGLDDRPVTVLIGQVASSDLGDALMSLAPDDDLSTAMMQMASRNFSQLPVLTADRRLVEVVSWESIGLASLRGATNLTLADTVDRRAREVSVDEELLEWIPTIYDKGYVFVRDEDRAITGVVTAADLTRQLGSQLKPFLLVAEIERRLRRIVDAALSDNVVTIEQIRRILGGRASGVSAAKDLTMGQYRLLFQNPSVWAALGWRIDDSLFTQRLKVASTFRNNLMHLNPDLDAEDESELAPLEGLLTVLRSLDRTN